MYICRNRYHTLGCSTGSLLNSVVTLRVNTIMMLPKEKNCGNEIILMA